ncbi:RhoGAP-domain-containing protein [Laetiporus sulphureus 93-53]|uniref:RhoGAP-domain-containing protein n=1 Tax=Laetiporus sulphureus 93-53 TaxID=1314785 RepID=A0A165E5D8_9APHY|nr:RhoGAP-domain-containing protein [Laetiporus sulphureus 93-53]KZT06270.1 RhoGAP-domain-containing protein [Laetiporus sulphureus 93-53]
MSSSLESAPSNRPSLSDHPHDAIALFDLHLRFLSDSYLSFFLERKKIEETYVESLHRLHRKVKAADAILDNPNRNEPSTTRRAWAEIRDNVAREADTRQAFLESLTTDVITPLISLKETQERIRKRIKEDLKEAVTTHADYAENVLTRLRRNYVKKCQDVDEFKAAIALPYPSPASPPDLPVSLPTSRRNPSPSPRSNAASPPPFRPIPDRRPSLGGVSTHGRSQSTATALQDLAHQGKRQLNQLMTFLDKGGNMKDLAGRSDNALRSVRAKREAEEADKEYRRGVHWLETLRLRRVKILESGYNSLESFIRESADTVKSTLMKYTDNMIATAASQSQICEHGREDILKISSQRDITIIAPNIARQLSASIPKPVYYHNHLVGECRDLIFGVSLVDYATSRNLPEGEVPKIVRICVSEIEMRGLEAEGIYRVSGRHAAVQELQHQIERSEAAFQFNPAIDDVYAVASLLKLYLRELPEPLFKYPLNERIQHSEELDGHRMNDFQLLRSKLRRLPPVHQATLKMIVEHLSLVASRADKNKMDAKNLAIVFSTVIFGEDEMPKGGDLLSVQSWKDTLAEDLILNVNVLFQSNGSPALPAAPLGGPVPPASYGSSFTTFGNMPPPSMPSSNRSPRLIRSPSLPPRPSHSYYDARDMLPDDFTPQLPSQASHNIHPSRTGPMSSLLTRQSLPPPERPKLDEHRSYIIQAPLTPSVRSISGDSRRSSRSKIVPRQKSREPSPDSTLMSRKERWKSPSAMPRMPSRPLTPGGMSSRAGTPSTVYSGMGTDEFGVRSGAQVVEPRDSSFEEEFPPSASTTSTFASLDTSMSKGSEAIRPPSRNRLVPNRRPPDNINSAEYFSPQASSIGGRSRRSISE